MGWEDGRWGRGMYLGQRYEVAAAAAAAAAVTAAAAAGGLGWLVGLWWRRGWVGRVYLGLFVWVWVWVQGSRAPRAPGAAG